MVEKCIRKRICHSIYRYPKANDKYLKDYDKNKELCYLQYLDVFNLDGGAMPQRLPLKKFKWIKDISKFDKNFIKSYNEQTNQRYFLQVDVENSKSLHNFHSDLPFFPERIKMEIVKKLVANLHDKTEYVYI